jgi:hypothetical protein
MRLRFVPGLAIALATGGCATTWPRTHGSGCATSRDGHPTSYEIANELVSRQTFEATLLASPESRDEELRSRQLERAATAVGIPAFALAALALGVGGVELLRGARDDYVVGPYAASAAILMVGWGVGGYLSSHATAHRDLAIDAYNARFAESGACQ